MKKVYFKTFGCRTNIFDTSLMQANLKNYTLADTEEDADIIVVNSCTVTNSADSNVRNYISKSSKLQKKIVLAGCGSFSKGKELFESDKLFGVLGHSEKKNLDNLLNSHERFFSLGDLNSIDENIVESFKDKSKAFIKIQEGCDFRCSYCIIPFVRGNARSLDETLILKQIELLSTNGYGEFVLTGTNIGSYGKDKGTTLAKLLKKIAMLRGVRRIRLGSLEPVQIDDEFKELLGERWIEKHLHIALQHTSNEMLRIMRRRNNLEADLKLFLELRDKGFALGSDFIVGHPGESEAIFNEAFENFKDFPLTHIHAFTYSKRDGTHSATLTDVIDGNISKERLKKLQVVIKNNNLSFRKSQNTPLEVLVEEKKDDFYVGYDQFYNKIEINSHESILKDWIFVEDYERKEEVNYAKI